jgi:hypothetical protein
MTTKPKRKIMRSFKMTEISAVDVPAQEGAVVTIVKRGQFHKAGHPQQAIIDKLAASVRANGGLRKDEFEAPAGSDRIPNDPHEALNRFILIVEGMMAREDLTLFEAIEQAKADYPELFEAMDQDEKGPPEAVAPAGRA